MLNWYYNKKFGNTEFWWIDTQILCPNTVFVPFEKMKANS